MRTHPNLTKSLSFDDLKRLGWNLFRKHVDVIEYDDIISSKSINDYLPAGKSVIVYYPTTSESYGHYVALLRDGNDVYFYDSYGHRPDDKEIKWNKALYEEEENTLLRHLLNAGLDVDYSDHRHQKLSNDSATCGRHSLMRVAFDDLSNDEYDKVLRDKSRQYKTDPDNLVSHVIS